MKNRFASCFIDKELKVAAVLVPKFKLIWVPDSEKDALKRYIVSLYDDFKMNDVEEKCDRYVFFTRIN